jgi:hypothetical protein
VELLGRLGRLVKVRAELSVEGGGLATEASLLLAV